MLAAERAGFPESSTARRGMWIVGLGVTAAVLLVPSRGAAQIKIPGEHPRYGFEVEPHMMLQWTRETGRNAGWGPGARVSIPFMHDGPLKRLNNSAAIGLGADVSLFSYACGSLEADRNDREAAWWGERCAAQQFWFPAVLQWNFYFSEMISVFAEPGLALLHERRAWRVRCDTGVCDESDATTSLQFVLWGGARFRFSETVALTLRVGTLYMSAGASFFF